MKTVKKMTTSGAFVMTENAKVWASVGEAIKWIGFRATKEVDARKDLFCFSAKIDYDNENHKFSVFNFSDKAAIYVEYENEQGEYGKFLTQEDMKNWEINE